LIKGEIERLKEDLDRLHRERDAFSRQCSVMAEENYILEAESKRLDWMIKNRGRISQLALEPRFWSVSVKVITENFEGTEKIKDHFNFKTSERCKLSDLREQVKKEVLDKDDYLPVCTQCLVTARVMM